MTPEERKEAKSAQSVLERLLPDGQSRTLCLRFLCDTIRLAHQLAPRSWGVTLQKDLVRLNVGHIEVMTILQDRIHIVLDRNAIPPELLTIQGLQMDSKTPLYKWVACSSGCDFPTKQASATLPLIRASHHQLTTQAAATPRHNMTARAHSPGVLRYLAEVLDLDLPDPEFLAVYPMSLSALTFQAQFSRFEKQVRQNSGGDSFTSFLDGLPAEWEDYKQDVRVEALRRLNVPAWKKAEVGKGRILKRVIEAIEIYDPKRDLRNNLVAWQNRYGHKAKSHRALLDARADAGARRDFEQWAFDFFNDRSAHGQAFERFRQLAGDRYDLAAYLFFLKDWNHFMPIAPTTFDAAFQLLGIDLVTTKRCSWDNYSNYNQVLLAIQRALRDIAEVTNARLIDAHSFCWMLVRLKLPAADSPVIIPLPKIISGLQAIPLTAKPASNESETDTDFDKVDENQFAQRDAERRRLGRLAQDIAIQSEYKRLRSAGHPNPEQVVCPVWDEPSRGYDILSCEIDGTPRHIEVKAARQSGSNLSFFLTQNEWGKSRTKPNYCFYLVLEAGSKRPEVLIIESGEVSSDCLTSLNYLASIRTPGK